MSGLYVWSVVLGLGLFTYLIRFSFLGLLGGRPPSAAMQRVLRYVPTAVIPAMVAPMVTLDRATGGWADAHVWLAAAACALVGAATRNLLAAILIGMGGFHLLRAAGL